MKRRIGMLAGTALVLAAVIETSAPFFGQPNRVAASSHVHSSPRRTLHSLRMEVIVKATTIGYFQTILAGARRAAAQFGVQSLGYTGPNAESDDVGEIRLLKDAIARHPDFIVLAPNSSTKLDPAIAQAHRAGIKMILVDSPAPGADYQTYIATDYYKGGCRAANALAAAIKAKTGRAAGQVAYTTYYSAGVVASYKGFTACIARYRGIHIVRHLDAGGDVTKTEGIATRILKAFPHLVGFYGDFAFTLQGAAQAFAQLKVNHKRVSLVGLGGYDLAGRDLEAHRLDGTVLFDPFQMGYGGVAYGILAAAGLNVPRYVDSGAVLATPANARSPFIQGLLNGATRQPGIGL